MKNLLFSLLPFILGAVITAFIIPPLIRVVHIKHLFEPTDHRKTHEQIVPTIGGVAIFIGFVMSVFLSSYSFNLSEIRYLFPALILMLFIGLKDDLIVISPRKKFLAQLFTALMLVFMGNLRIVNLNGILNISELSYWESVPLSVFIIVTAINAFNLIDGIDGLASGVSFIASLVLGLGFLLLDHLEFAIIAFALSGSVAVFFGFNVFGKKYKLFMGDTGSLIIGTILVTLAFKFVEHGTYSENWFFANYGLALVVAILIVPIIDVPRVMMIRILQGRSPFFPDRNHIHHNVLKISSSHLSATLKILVMNLLFIAFSLLLIYLQFNINAIVALLFVTGFLFAWISYLIASGKLSNDRIRERYNIYPD